MKKNRFFSLLIFPLILWACPICDLLPPPEESHPVSVKSKMLEVPDYVDTPEFRITAQKKFLETFEIEVTGEMLSKPMRWLGYCYKFTGETSNTADGGKTPVKCGDKIKWGDKVYCLDW